MSLQVIALRWLDRAVYLALVVAILGPALYFPIQLQDTIKVGTEVHLTIMAWVLTGLIGVTQALRGRPFLGGGEGTWLRRLLAAFFGWMLLAGLWANHPGTYWGHAAVVGAFLLAAQSLWGWLEAAPGRRTFVVALFAVLASFEAAITVAQYHRLSWKWLSQFSTPNTPLATWLLVVDPRTLQREAHGTLGNPNYLGELLALLVPVLAGWGASRKALIGRTLFGLAAFAAFYALMLTGARASFGGLLIGGAFAAVATGAWRAIDLRAAWADTRTRIALVVVVLALAVAGATASSRLVAKLGAFANPMADASIESRLLNWQAGMDLWTTKPVQGIGLGEWKYQGLDALVKRHPAGVPSSTNDARFAQLHNDWLQALLEFGLVGFLLLFGALGAWLALANRNETLAPAMRWGLVGGVTAVLVAGLFGFPFHTPITAFAIMCCLALSASKEPEAEVISTDEAFQPAWRAPYALAVALLVAVVGNVAVDRGVLPLYRAAHYHYLAKSVEKQDRAAPAVGLLYGQALELDRFKAHHLYELMQWQIRTKHYAEAVATHDKWLAYGPGFSERALRGIANFRAGRKDEAKADLLATARFYDPDHANYRMAYKYLAKLHATEGLTPPAKKKHPLRPRPIAPRPQGSPGAGVDVKDDAPLDGDDDKGDADAS